MESIANELEASAFQVIMGLENRLRYECMEHTNTQAKLASLVEEHVELDNLADERKDEIERLKQSIKTLKKQVKQATKQAEAATARAEATDKKFAKHFKKSRPQKLTMSKHLLESAPTNPLRKQVLKQSSSKDPHVKPTKMWDEAALRVHMKKLRLAQDVGYERSSNLLLRIQQETAKFLERKSTWEQSLMIDNFD